MNFFRRILNISYTDHITNISVMQAITEAAGPQEPLLATVKRRKLQWFGHTTIHNTLAKEILQGAVKGGRKRGRLQKNVRGQHSRVDGSRATGVMRCCSQPSQMEKDLCGSLHPYDRPGQGMNEYIRSKTSSARVSRYAHAQIHQADNI